MPIEITMPRLSDTMEEGTLVKWRVAVGDAVEAGDHLADVETDKATMELQAFDDGKIARIDVEEGDTVPVGQLILVLAEEGEEVDAAAKHEGGSGSSGGGGDKKKKEESDTGEDKEKDTDAAETSSEDAKKTPDSPGETSGGTSGGGRVKSSPLARKLAEEHGVDLATVEGSGPSGRVVKADVLAAAESGGGAKGKGASGGGQGPAHPQEVQPATPAPQSFDPGATLEEKSIKLSNMRKTIAKRLVESKTTVPHFQVSLSIDMDPLIELRQTLNTQLAAQGIKLSVNDFITRATALACLQHPAVNSSWNDDTIQQHGTVGVGIAVALPQEKGGGLVVPVIRDVQTKGLRQISQETKALAKKARDTGLATDEMAGGTITISNLGMYGVDQFNAIINPPQAAILAVGGAIEKPVVKEGLIVIGHVMTATLSGDHRVIDGAVAAEYLTTFKQLLENPAGLLV